MQRRAFLLALPVMLGSLPLSAKPVLQPNGEAQPTEITEAEAKKRYNESLHKAADSPCIGKMRGRFWFVHTVAYGFKGTREKTGKYVDKVTGKVFPFFPIEAHWFVDNAPPEPLTAEEARAIYFKHIGYPPGQFLPPKDRSRSEALYAEKVSKYWHVYYPKISHLSAQSGLYIDQQTGQVFDPIPADLRTGKKGGKKKKG